MSYSVVFDCLVTRIERSLKNLCVAGIAPINCIICMARLWRMLCSSELASLSPYPLNVRSLHYKLLLLGKTSLTGKVMLQSCGRGASEDPGGIVARQQDGHLSRVPLQRHLESCPSLQVQSIFLSQPPSFGFLLFSPFSHFPLSLSLPIFFFFCSPVPHLFYLFSSLSRCSSPLFFFPLPASTPPSPCAAWWGLNFSPKGKKKINEETNWDSWYQHLCIEQDSVGEEFRSTDPFWLKWYRVTGKTRVKTLLKGHVFNETFLKPAHIVDSLCYHILSPTLLTYKWLSVYFYLKSYASLHWL